MTSPTSAFEQPSFSSFDISIGSTGSDELSDNTSTISSLMYLRNLMMLNPAIDAIAPSTTTTNTVQVAQNVRINVASGPSELRPYRPTVNAIAPNAPMGAKRINILTMPKTTCVSASITSTRGLQRAPMLDKAKPNSNETRTTLKMLPRAKASTTVAGIIWSRKSLTVCALACPA